MRPIRFALLVVLALAGCTGQLGMLPGDLLPDGGLADGGGSDAGPTCGPRFSGPGEIVASGLSVPRQIAWNGRAIFVTEMGVLNKPYGRVLEIDPEDGGITALAQNRFAPDAILATPDAVFWSEWPNSNPNTGGVFRYPLPNGPATRIDSTVNETVAGHTSLSLGSGGLLYATGKQYLMWIPLDGGTSSVLFQGSPSSTVRSAVVEGGQGWFLLDDTSPGGGVDAGVYTLPLDGSSEAVRVWRLPGTGQSLTVTPEALFWSVETADGGEIQTAPRDGGSVVTLAQGLSGPGALLPLGPELYFADSTVGSPPSPSFLQALPDCPGAGPTPLGPTGAGPGALISPDGGFLLFTSSAGSGQGYIGRLDPAR